MKPTHQMIDTPHLDAVAWQFSPQAPDPPPWVGKIFEQIENSWVTVGAGGELVVIQTGDWVVAGYGEKRACVLHDEEFKRLFRKLP